jgi:hypothetical protein
MTQTLLHFGYAKTATTYLQRRIFPSATGVNYLGKPFDLELGKMEALVARHTNFRIRKIDRFDPFFNHEDAMRVQDYDEIDLSSLEGHYRNILSDKMLNVWSHEGYLRPGRKSSALDRKRAIANIKTVFETAGSEDVRALIVLRDTQEMLRSFSVQFHRDFDYLRVGDLPLQEVLEFRKQGQGDRYTQLLWRLWYEYLDYQSMVEDLINAFGNSRVYVLKYEDMVRDWGLLEDLMRSIDPGVKCNFPIVRENATEDKSVRLSLGLQAYLASIESCNIEDLFPGNYAPIEDFYFSRDRAL